MAMEHIPLKFIDDEYTIGRTCAVCGENALSVEHVENLPDYVKCTSCESAFILNEAADWAMYGSVSQDYPETGQMVLKRWTTLEAVQTMASSERATEFEVNGSEPELTEKEKPASETTPALGFGGNGAANSADGLAAPTPPFGIGELDEFEAENADGSSDPNSNPDASEESTESFEEIADVSEPEAGQRYVVTLAQKTASLPSERCAHCLRRPAPRKLLLALGTNQDLGYQVPLCESCHSRASVRSEEQKTSKLVAHLSSVLIAGVLIVGALAAGLVDLQELGMIDLLLIGMLGLVGYGVTAFLLLRRSSKLPPSEDALFVRTTLRLRDHKGLAFAWRNRGYAELFSSANQDYLLGDMVRISDENTQNS